MEFAVGRVLIFVLLLFGLTYASAEQFVDAGDSIYQVRVFSGGSGTERNVCMKFADYAPQLVEPGCSLAPVEYYCLDRTPAGQNPLLNALLSGSKRRARVELVVSGCGDSAYVGEEVAYISRVKVK